MELDEPIDYSTPAYRLAKSVNDYFAGWEPSPEYLSAAEFEEFRQKELGTCDAVTQTPPEWLCQEAAQRPIEVEPRRAPPLNRTLSIGTTRPHAPVSPPFGRWPSLSPIPKLTLTPCACVLAEVKAAEPKRPAFSWSPAGEAYANNHEMLFYALLLLYHAVATKTEEHIRQLLEHLVIAIGHRLCIKQRVAALPLDVVLVIVEGIEQALLRNLH